MLNPALRAKLNASLGKRDGLLRLLAEPATQADRVLSRTYSKSLAELQPLADRYAAIVAIEDELAEAREIAANDPELRPLAADDVSRLEARLIDLETELLGVMLPDDPNDDRNIVLEIRAGAGGDEAALFAADLFRMYSRYAERSGWAIDVVSVSEADGRGLKEVIASIEGKSAFRCLKYESGVHRVQRVPATETNGRVHTSTATVAVLPEPAAVEIHIDPKDLRIDITCSSGPGGQSVNTTYSAVRLTHIPSGIVVSQQDEKSQTKNKQKAMRVLRARLYDLEAQKQHETRAQERRNQVGMAERAEKIRTYNVKDNRVTDHRIAVTLHKLSQVLDGDLQELIAALRNHEQTERLKRLGE